VPLRFFTLGAERHHGVSVLFVTFRRDTSQCSYNPLFCLGLSHHYTLHSAEIMKFLLNDRIFNCIKTERWTGLPGEFFKV